MADPPGAPGVAAPGGPPVKRKRATKLEAATSGLAKAEAKLKGLEVATAALEHAASVARSGASFQKKQAALTKHKTKITAAKAEVAAAQQKLEKESGAAEDRAAAAAAKRAKAAAETDRAKKMSDDGIIKLITLRLEMQARFDDKSNQNENLWAIIAEKFQAAVDAGELPAGDARSVSSLKAKWSEQDGEFKQHVRLIERRRQSGAPREDIGASHQTL